MRLRALRSNLVKELVQDEQVCPQRAFYFLTEFNDHLKVASVLQDVLASLLLYINVFFDIEKLLVDNFHFVAPLHRVERSLKNLVLFCLFEQKLLLFIAFLG